MTNARRFALTFLLLLTGLPACSDQWGIRPSPSASVEKSAPGGLQRYDPDDLKRRLDCGEKVFLLDVREPQELAEVGAIEGYVNIPMSQLETRLEEVPRDRPVVVY